MSWHDFADLGLGELFGLVMSLCHLEQVVVGLPVEKRRLEAVVVRLVVTAAERRRHDELLAQQHYLHNFQAVGRSCVTWPSTMANAWRYRSSVRLPGI